MLTEKLVIDTSLNFKAILEKYQRTPAYAAIRNFYEGKKAARSGVPYMQHIDEGIIVLAAIGAFAPAVSAYCAHPLVQNDEDLPKNIGELTKLDPSVVVLTMEYRNVANRGLSCYQTDDPATIYLGPSKSVHLMLVADKVQNRKDFLRHHFGKHEKSAELDRYFRNWLRALNVTEQDYATLCACMAQIHDNPEAEMRANYTAKHGESDAAATLTAFWNEFVEEYAPHSTAEFVGDVRRHVHAIQNAIIAKQVAMKLPDTYAEGYLGTHNQRGPV